MQADKSQLQQNILAAPVYSPMPMPLPVQAVGPRSITNEAAAAMVAERGETVILEGIFSPSFVQYTLACACLGIFGSFMWPFFLLIPCILMGIKAQYQSFKIILSDKTVTFMRGSYACCCTCWSETERIVPLEKITDCTWKQNCLQRQLGVDQLDIRTAAGNLNVGEGGGGADISLVGLVESKAFRTALMRAKDQRDHFLSTGVIVEGGGGSGGASAFAAPMSQQMHQAPALASSQETTQALSSIDSTLQAIKDLLFEKADSVKIVSDVESA